MVVSVNYTMLAPLLQVVSELSPSLVLDMRCRMPLSAARHVLDCNALEMPHAEVRKR